MLGTPWTAGRRDHEGDGLPSGRRLLAVAGCIAWAAASGFTVAQDPPGTEALIEQRLAACRSSTDATFGSPPTDDFAALPDGVFAMVSWNIQVGGTSPTSTTRPPQVEMALAEMYDGTYQLLAAQEISSDDHSAKLLEHLPGPPADWSASFTDSTSTMDNGYWFRAAVAIQADDLILHAVSLDSTGKVSADEARAFHPPRIAHVTVGDFDFTLINVHLTFQGHPRSPSDTPSWKPLWTGSRATRTTRQTCSAWAT